MKLIKQNFKHFQNWVRKCSLSAAMEKLKLPFECREPSVDELVLKPTPKKRENELFLSKSLKK